MTDDLCSKPTIFDPKLDPGCCSARHVYNKDSSMLHQDLRSVFCPVIYSSSLFGRQTSDAFKDNSYDLVGL